jgi:hypothetical protein
MSRTAPEVALAERLHRLAEHARTEPSVAPEPLVAQHRERRRPTWTTGLAAALLVAALASASLVLRQDSSGRIGTSGEPAALAAGATGRLAASGLTGRTGAASVWTGEELLVWGGLSPDNKRLADGAALDPVANRWRPLPRAPISARGYPAAVWTGSEMVVWSGSLADEPFLDGAAFNPRTNSWRSIASNPFEGANRPAVVWTGTEMLVFSSVNAPRRASAYNPATDRWRRLPPPPGLLVTPDPEIAWTGSEAVLLLAPDTSTQPPGPDTRVIEGPPAQTAPQQVGGGPNSNPFLASYSVASDKWSRLPAAALTERVVPRLVWTGREVLVLQIALPSLAFDPQRKSWRSLATAPEDQPSFDLSAAWSGRLVLFWAGGEEGLAYDPELDRWSTFDAGGLRRRADAVVVWADGLLVGWGGYNYTNDRRPRVETDGIRYRPPG